jgi:hypothetical protein
MARMGRSGLHEKPAAGPLSDDVVAAALKKERAKWP